TGARPVRGSGPYIQQTTAIGRHSPSYQAGFRDTSAGISPLPSFGAGRFFTRRSLLFSRATVCFAAAPFIVRTQRTSRVLPPDKITRDNAGYERSGNSSPHEPLQAESRRAGGIEEVAAAPSI